MTHCRIAILAQAQRVGGCTGFLIRVVAHYGTAQRGAMRWCAAPYEQAFLDDAHCGACRKKPERFAMHKTLFRGLVTALTLAGMAHLAVAVDSDKAVKPDPQVGIFRSGSGAVPAPWAAVQLNKKIPPTKYRLEVWDGVPAIRADANASMALMARPVAVDLQATPVLCWRWRIGGVVQSADLATKKGDDYAARVYVTFTLPASALNFGTRTKLRMARAIYGDQVPDAAMNYVWDNTHAVGTRVPNAYTDRAQMVVLRSGNQQAGQWVHERVNVLEDVRHTFGTAEAQISSLAVASDTDNTGETAQAGFADLHFVASGAPCTFSKGPPS